MGAYVHKQGVGGVDDVLAAEEDTNALGAWLDMRELGEGEGNAGHGGG